MDFQTHPSVCSYMVSLMPVGYCGKILEPTAGEGNLVKALAGKGVIIAPKDFFNMQKEQFDWVVMNPPFSPMKLGYKILYASMEMSNNIIALMPWLTIINGEKRTRDLINFGLKTVIHLPRKVFKGARVQCCILELQKGYKEETKLKWYLN
jgi:type I restriction-modification system DNA methylase subunit